MIVTQRNCVTEWHFSPGQAYTDPFNDVDLDVLVTDPDGEERRVPAFWSGESTWRVRYASPKLGTHRWRSECSDTSNPDLHGREGAVEVVPYSGRNPLMLHGPLRVSESGRHFEHVDGTPFFWLADTWWMGLCERLQWPGDFQTLTSDRVRKGFSVIQTVAGLYPDMGWRDPRQVNEAGYPWDEAFNAVEPAYFDHADLRLHHLVRSGLVPCIVACWGYYLPLMGLERMKKHWRNLVARYGAYPVVWCLAGEASMPFYLSTDRENEERLQMEGWTEMAAYMRAADPYRRPVTIHPSGPGSSRDDVVDTSDLDFIMLQTGHADRVSLPDTLRIVSEEYAAEPVRPVINGEVTYEGLAESNRQEIQRWMFWACVLGGAAGHSYGANGIWQVNHKDAPYGKSPGGQSWGDTAWDDAYVLPGSGQLGLSKRFLERFRWWDLQPRPDWVEHPATPGEPHGAYAAGIPRRLRFVYVPGEVSARGMRTWRIDMKGIESDVDYRALLFNPVDGSETDLGPVEPDSEGRWRPPWNRAPVFQDWVVVLEAR